MVPNISLEERIKAMEVAIADLQQQVAAAQPVSWLHQITGSFKDEPAFDEVLAYGRAIRKEELVLAEAQDDL